MFFNHVSLSYIVTEESTFTLRGGIWVSIGTISLSDSLDLLFKWVMMVYVFFWSQRALIIDGIIMVYTFCGIECAGVLTFF